MQNLDNIFKGLDIDKSGFLDLNEFSKLIQIFSQNCSEEVYKPIYEMLNV